MRSNVYRIVFLSVALAVAILDVVFGVMTGLTATAVKAGLSFTPVWFKPFCITVLTVNPILAVLGILYPIIYKK